MSTDEYLYWLQHVLGSTLDEYDAYDDDDKYDYDDSDGGDHDDYDNDACDDNTDDGDIVWLLFHHAAMAYVITRMLNP